MTTTTESESATTTQADGSTARVLICDEIAAPGIEAMQEKFDVTVTPGWSEDELADRVADFDAIVVRSATKLPAHIIEKADRLKVVGRAGVGVDNIDLAAASAKGVIVVNAPTSTVMSAAEHTIGLCFTLMRNIARADASMRAGKWDRSSFKGAELADKTITIVGFGRIGQIVGERARALGMKVRAYDPYVSRDRFDEMGVTRVETVEEAVADSDIVTIHLPLLDDTKGIVNADLIGRMRPGTRLINAARGPLVNIDDVHAAIQSGHLGGVAMDVYEVEPPEHHPLFAEDNVVLTPHIAASTAEAQDRASLAVADQIAAVLTGGSATSAVNMPSIAQRDVDALAPFGPLTARLARLATALAGGNVEAITVTARGTISEYDVRVLSTATLVSVFSTTQSEPVNVVNAFQIAERRGIDVHEKTDRNAGSFNDLVEVTAHGDRNVTAMGTTLGHEHRPWMMGLLGFDIELELDARAIVLEYEDVPGMVGRIGTAFGEAGINIAKMAVSRNDGSALMVLTVDGDVDDSIVQQLASQNDFTAGWTVSLAG